jgi:integrase/recombinase XerD
MDPPCATRRLRRRSEQADLTIARMHPHMLRHTLVTTMRYHRARKNLARHSTYILAAYMASGPLLTNVVDDSAFLRS